MASTVALAHRLGLRVVAEGLEHAALAHLAALDLPADGRAGAVVGSPAVPAVVRGAPA